jgi:hypothetical protein
VAALVAKNEPDTAGAESACAVVEQDGGGTKGLKEGQGATCVTRNRRAVRGPAVRRRPAPRRRGAARRAT